MITRKQAKNVRLRCPDDKMRWDIFIDSLYDSIGDAKMSRILKDCPHCGYIEYRNIIDEYGQCIECQSNAKQIEQIKEEKKRIREERREKSGYFQNTGKYKNSKKRG